jgi:hypothetical protein
MLDLMTSNQIKIRHIFDTYAYSFHCNTLKFLWFNIIHHKIDGYLIVNIKGNQDCCEGFFSTILQ